jgi:hypothetical protein
MGSPQGATGNVPQRTAQPAAGIPAGNSMTAAAGAKPAAPGMPPNKGAMGGQGAKGNLLAGLAPSPASATPTPITPPGTGLTGEAAGGPAQSIPPPAGPAGAGVDPRTPAMMAARAQRDKMAGMGAGGVPQSKGAMGGQAAKQKMLAGLGPGVNAAAAPAAGAGGAGAVSPMAAGMIGKMMGGLA